MSGVFSEIAGAECCVLQVHEPVLWALWSIDLRVALYPKELHQRPGLRVRLQTIRMLTLF
jgi:predicted metalloenzyme YecM